MIFTQHVLEHFYDSLQQLRAYRELLLPGGYLVTMVPNRDYVGTLISGFIADPAFLYPMHLNYFTADGLKCLHEQAGFRMLHIVNTANFGFAPTMKDEALSLVGKLHPEAKTDEQKVKTGSENFLFYEILCIAQRV